VATIQHSIQVKVPVQTAYNQLTQFEEFPRFMHSVDAVEQIDDNHLHWRTKMADQPVEWDAEIVEQEPDRCIAWRSTSGPRETARLDVLPLGQDGAEVTFTIDVALEELQESIAGRAQEEMSRRLREDMERMREYIEAHGRETAGWRGEIHDAKVTLRDRDAKGRSGAAAGGQGQRVQNEPAPMGGHAPTAAVVGAAGGTDASAGAKMSGSKGPDAPGLRESTTAEGAAGSAVKGDAVTPGAGSPGGTGLGAAGSAEDTRTGTGGTSGSASSLTGGGMSGARDAGKGKA